MNKKTDIQYSIDTIRRSKTALTIVGWATSRDPQNKVYIDVTDETGNFIKYQKSRISRKDVSIYRYGGEIQDALYGFVVTFPYKNGKTYNFRMFNGKCEVLLRLTNGYIQQKILRNNVLKFMRGQTIRNYFVDTFLGYNHWFHETCPSNEELEKQRTYPFPASSPKFSIVIPLYETPKKYLRELLDSLLKQTYANFEVCFADGSPEGTKLENTIKQHVKEDSRFKYQFIGSNKGISENTNVAVKMATGDFIVLCDHDDLLTPNALFEFAKAIINNPECDTIYSDEDKINGRGTILFEPHFKPDFNIDMLTSVNYICHLFGVRKSLVDQYGAFDSQFDGSQDYDFIFRMTEHSRKVIHVAKILYHWRTHVDSTSGNPESKLYAFKAGARAIMAHYARIYPSMQIEKVERGVSLGIYHTCFKFEQQPLVSIIIPNKDHTEDLDVAIRSIITRNTWKNLEFVIVENNSVDVKTTEYYKKITEEFSQVHVVYYKDSFNFSKICNFGAKEAHGNYLLFMNNDVELMNPDSISEMMGYAQRKDVGIVGCRLLYQDNTIQHAGVVIGVGGIADHVFRGHLSANDTYFNLAMTAQDYSAVTAAVMMVRKDVFEEAGEFDENFAVAFNDIDFCLKVRTLDKLVVYNPYASFHHYESKSRGAEDTYEKQLRFVSEIKLFLTKWKDFIIAGDPYYNPNLTVHDGDFSTRILGVEKIGETFYSPDYIDFIIKESPETIVNKQI
jgi:Predicted glycosyltransferases